MHTYRKRAKLEQQNAPGALNRLFQLVAATVSLSLQISSSPESIDYDSQPDLETHTKKQKLEKNYERGVFFPICTACCNDSISNIINMKTDWYLIASGENKVVQYKWFELHKDLTTFFKFSNKQSS